MPFYRQERVIIVFPNGATPGRVGGPDPLTAAIGRHPTALGQRLDAYLDAVARELRAVGVITGSPQRTDPSGRLIGSIVIDCTALRDVTAKGPAPVVITWDEVTGWCAGLHDDSASSSRRYLHVSLLPLAVVVAAFVVELALGRPVGAAGPIGGAGPAEDRAPARPRLRVV